MTVLSHVTLPPSAPPPPGGRPRWILFLHGIFGSGANWRSFAKRWMQDHPTWGAVLVDLRMHGRSRGFAPPHTVAAAARDLFDVATLVPGPVDAVVGHSFGGKVALAYVAARRGDLDVAWIVDSTPSARPDFRGSEGTVRVMEILEGLPAAFASREAFGEALAAAGIDAATSTFLATNLESADGAYRLRLDLGAVRALLDDYFRIDLWSVVEPPPGRVALRFVAGGLSNVLGGVDRARLDAAAARFPGRVRLDTIDGAGHWVHVDAPDALRAAMNADVPPR